MALKPKATIYIWLAKNEKGSAYFGTVVCGNEREDFSARAKRLTNRLDVTALAVSIGLLRGSHIIDVYTNSEYIVKVNNNNWLKEWEKNGFVTKDGKPVKFSDLWRRVSKLNKKHSITYILRDDVALDDIEKRCKENAERELNG